MNYIGIDVGDGESCVCVLEQHSGIEPCPIALTGRKSFISAVATDAWDRPIIGMDAIGDSAATDFAVRFKSKFLRGEERDVRDMRRFLRGIYEELVQMNVLTREDKVVLGCPAGWDHRARERYLALIREAGFPSPRLVSESRAAFLYAKHARSIQLDAQLLQHSALVIDIGSSTLDFAYVLEGRESGVGTFGDVYLGGGAIDEALLAAAVNASPQRAAIKAVFEEAPEWRNHCLLSARRVKEEYFIRQSEGQNGVQCRETVTILYDEPFSLLIQANDQLMWRIIQLGVKALDGQSFFQMLNAALAYAVRQTKDFPPELVLLTGGASRMKFFQEQCAAHFSNAHLVLCAEPEYSISKGLAFSARVDEQIFAFNAEIRAFLESGALRAAIARRLPEVIDVLTGAMTDIVFGEVGAAIADWQNGRYATLEALNRALPDRLRQSLASPVPKEAVAAAINGRMAEICLSIQGEIDRICLAHHVEQSQMRLVQVDALSPESVRAPFEIGDEAACLTRPLQIAITGMVAGILLLIPGGGIVDLILIAATAAAVALGQEHLKNVTTTMNIPMFLRNRIRPERIATIDLREKLRKSIQEQIEKDTALWENVIAAVERSISEHVRGMARRTEIAIISEGEENHA